MNRCNFTGKELNKYNRFYNQDGTYTDIDVYQFLENIPNLPKESLEKLRDMSMDALGEKLTFWQKFIGAFKNRKR